MTICDKINLAILEFWQNYWEESEDPYGDFLSTTREELLQNFSQKLSVAQKKHFLHCPECTSYFHGHYLIREEMAVYNDFND